MLNARLIDELERSQRELAARAETERSLRDIASRITSLGDPSELLERVVEESRRLLGSDGAHLTRMSDDGTFLVPVIVAGGMDTDTESWLKGMQFPLGGGINGLAAEEVQPVWTYDYATDPRIPHELDDDLAAERLQLRALGRRPAAGAGGRGDRDPRGVVRPPARDPARRARPPPGPRRPGRDRPDERQPLRAPRRVRGPLPVPRQNAPDLVWSIDADAKFTFVSDSTSQRLTGWRADEVLGKHFGALVHESSREVAEIDWTASLGEDDGSGGRELRGRVNLLHKDGHPIRPSSSRSRRGTRTAGSPAQTAASAT
jgi:PAS domain S-box-containing protein